MRADRLQDAILLTLATLALAVECAVLLGQMRVIQLPFDWGLSDSNAPVIGFVREKAHAVTSRGEASLTWYPVAEGDRIHEQDTVMTGDNSTAVIALDKHEEIVLEPHTLVRFTIGNADRTDSFLAFELNQGTIKVKSDKTHAVHVRVPSREIVLHPDSEAVLTASALSTQSDVRVDRGEVTLEGAPIASDNAARSPAVQLDSGEAARLSPGRGLARLDTHLSIVPKFPENDMRLLAQGSVTDVHFQWEGAQGDAVEVDHSPQFTSPTTIRAEGVEALGELPPGRYFWRVRQTVSASDAADFTILPRPRYRLLEPEAGATVKAHGPLTLTWEPVDDAVEYLCEVSDRRDFRHVLRHETVHQPTAELAGLRPGTYYWRVTATHRDLGRLIASVPVAFTLSKKRAAPPKPKGAKVLPRSGRADPPARAASHAWLAWLDAVADWIVPPAFAEGKVSAAPKAQTLWMEFEWDASPDAARYRLEVSQDREFHRVVAKLEVADTHAILQLPDHAKFFWRLASIDTDGDMGPYSETQVMQRTQAVTPEEAQRRLAALEAARKAKNDSPPAAAARLPAAVEQAPSVVEPFFRPQEARLGYAASFIDESQASPSYGMNQNGFPLNQIQAEFGISAGSVALELRGWYQPLLAQATNSAAAALRYTQWGVEALWANPFTAWRLPWLVGLRAANEGDFVRAGADDLAVRGAWVPSALIGPRWQFRESRWGPWYADFLLDLAPVGGRRGAGLLARSYFSLPALLGLRPAFELSAHPVYRLGLESGSHAWDVEITGALSLAWVFDSEASGAGRTGR